MNIVYLISWFFAAVFLDVAEAFYFPGVTPTDYQPGEQLNFLVNTLVSTGTLIPYDFYDERFHMCRPEAEPKSQSESLGSILLGDRLYDSSIQLNMLENVQCKTWCQVTIPGADAQFITSRIKEYYSINWILDGLPAAQLVKLPNATVHTSGFYLGYNEGSTVYFNNHYEITIQYHQVKSDQYRVVGVVVDPYSIERTSSERDSCESQNTLILDENGDNKVVFSYSINWESSPTPWAVRWDAYSSVSSSEIHWYSIVNSCVIALLLSGMVAIILVRALHYDISRYNNKIETEEMEDSGWKLVHADVFRPPPHRMVLAALVGTGVQILFLVLFSILIAAFGFFSPAKRGLLGTVMLVVFVLLSGVSGYTTIRLYKYLGGVRVNYAIGLVAFGIPGLLFLVFLTLNFFFIGEKSSSAVPFGTIAALFFLWVLLSAPLCIFGGIFGNKAPIPENPCKYNAIPREIPPQTFYLHELITLLAGGILPFGAAFVELYFILTSIWFNRIYFVFGFLLLVILIVVITAAESAVLLCYSQLCAEDYKWQWRSFRTVGFSGVYVFFFGTLFGLRRLHPDSISSFFLFIGWSTVVSAMVAVFTGSIGYLCCLFFVRKIFASIKID